MNQGPAAAVDAETLSKLSQFRAQRRSEEDSTTEAAGNLAARAPAGDRLTVGGAKLTPGSTNEAGAKLLSTSQREALSARLKDARAAAGDLKDEADNQTPQTYYSVPDTVNAINTTPNNGGDRKLQSSCTSGGVTVTSSEFPLLEGCLAEIDIFTNDGFEYLSLTGLIIADVPAGFTEVCFSSIFVVPFAI